MEKKEENTKTIAITGGICTGKSFVLEGVKSKGSPVFSCDEEIKKIRDGDKEVKRKILEEFPKEKGDKVKIQETIFNDKNKKKKLEDILYPELEKKRKEFLSKNKGKVVFIEVPLLYEKGKEMQYDKVVVVSCSAETQKQRAINRGINTLVLDNIVKSQLSTEEKSRKADYIINSEGTHEETKKKIEEIYREIQKK